MYTTSCLTNVIQTGANVGKITEYKSQIVATSFRCKLKQEVIPLGLITSFEPILYDLQE